MMRSAAGWVLVSLLCAAPGAVLAQAIGERAPDFVVRENNSNENTSEAHKSIESNRGRLVVIYFFRASDAPSVEYLSTVNEVGRMPGVFPIVLSLGKEEEARRVAEEKLTAAHLLGWEMRTIAEMYDVSDFPRAYLIDPNGFIAWRGHPGELKERVREQIRLTPPVGADTDSLRKKLALAHRALSTNDPGRAFTLVQQVFDLSTEGEELHTEAEKLRTEIEKKAQQWLEEARGNFDAKKESEACKVFAEIKVRMEGRDIIDEVETDITKARGARETKKMLEDALKEVRGEVALEQAADLLDLKRFVDAERAYREIVEKFEGAPAAATAEEALKKMREDPETQKVILAHYDSVQAWRWLDLGDRFAQLKLTKQAREYYDRVRNEYPTSEAAKAAEKKLKALPSET